MADEDDSQGADAAEAFEAMRGELALLRRAVEGLAAERSGQDMPNYTETLGVLQQGVNTAGENIARIGQFLKAAPALAMTPEQMAQRIAAAGNAARREDQAALAKAGEDKAGVMAELRAIAGSAWTRADQKNRQLWFGLGGVVAGLVLWAILAGPIARAVPESWQWPEKMAARSLRMPMWEGGQRMMRVASPDAFAAIVAGDRIIAANREALAACRKRANKAHDGIRCAVKLN
ncbi:hypothetical protein J2X47_004644 [Sphingomonas sp. BE270]|uniref:DUF6118 family protein n=1 Tax=unclassified Sphingomonas TaxID=196159 RepID=UPI000F88A7DD|nr:MULTISPECIES: DUF6118 family protein [unclassified Sphingomonas]MDR7260435.1 hypothetical protein [Sphingomonas sp. BE270]RUN74701.1 hypothetical protein EJC47_20195 [Sphingomonas sp. TF3]